MYSLWLHHVTTRTVTCRYLCMKDRIKLLTQCLFSNTNKHKLHKVKNTGIFHIKKQQKTYVQDAVLMKNVLW